jgi:hypothetical protein
MMVGARKDGSPQGRGTGMRVLSVTAAFCLRARASNSALKLQAAPERADISHDELCER